MQNTIHYYRILLFSCLILVFMGVTFGPMTPAGFSAEAPVKLINPYEEAARNFVPEKPTDLADYVIINPAHLAPNSMGAAGKSKLQATSALMPKIDKAVAIAPLVPLSETRTKYLDLETYLDVSRLVATKSTMVVVTSGTLSLERYPDVRLNIYDHSAGVKKA